MKWKIQCSPIPGSGLYYEWSAAGAPFGIDGGGEADLFDSRTSIGAALAMDCARRNFAEAGFKGKPFWTEAREAR